MWRNEESRFVSYSLHFSLMKNERKSHSRGLLVRIGCIAALFLASEISSHPPIPFAIPIMVARWL